LTVILTRSPAGVDETFETWLDVLPVPVPRPVVWYTHVSPTTAGKNAARADEPPLELPPEPELTVVPEPPEPDVAELPLDPQPARTSPAAATTAAEAATADLREVELDRFIFRALGS
jgi:hypothetical protein